MKMKMMKWFCLSLFGLATTYVTAQPGGGNFDPQAMVQQQTDEIALALSLDEATKAKVLEINQAAMAQMQKAREENQGDWEAMRGIREQVNAERDEQFKLLFSYEQWTKYEAWQAERAANRPQGGRPGGPQGTPPEGGQKPPKEKKPKGQ
ncbi:MAG: hypothetical protein SF052_22685 [Bacteroidia bacterium]|nr:hypothetical protein [Bacteroidia bacterium]